MLIELLMKGICFVRGERAECPHGREQVLVFKVGVDAGDVQRAMSGDLLHELRGEPEPPFADLLAKMSPVDLILVEGYKREPHPKLEIYRAANGKPLIHPEDPHIVAVASDQPIASLPLPWVSLDDVEAIVDLLLAQAMPLEQMVRGGSA